MDFLKDAAAAKDTRKRTFTLYTQMVDEKPLTTTISIYRPVQKQRDAEAEAMRDPRVRKFNRAKWAREFARNRIFGWENLTLYVFDNVLFCPVLPGKRAQVVAGFEANGGMLPYSEKNAAWLVEHADEEALVAVIERETELWRQEGGVDLDVQEDEKS